MRVYWLNGPLLRFLRISSFSNQTIKQFYVVNTTPDKLVFLNLQTSNLIDALFWGDHLHCSNLQWSTIYCYLPSNLKTVWKSDPPSTAMCILHTAYIQSSRSCSSGLLSQRESIVAIVCWQQAKIKIQVWRLCVIKWSDSRRYKLDQPL